jgi:DegV family protein with EDD domain
MVKLFADTTSGLTVQEASSLNIEFMPQIIIFGSEEFRDDNEITTKEFLDRLVASKDLPKTAAPAPILYEPAYEEIAKSGNSGIVICPSAKLSGTVRSASDAKLEFPDADIRIIDSHTIGGGLASLVLEAAKLIDQGKSADEIEKHICEMSKREQNFFVVDTLEFLKRGGRIGSAAALLGSILQMKPILGLRDGQAAAIDKQRTQKRALERIKELVQEDFNKSKLSYFCVMHGNALEKAQILAGDFSEMLGITEIPIYELPPAFLTHTGPGILGVSYFTD